MDLYSVEYVRSLEHRLVDMERGPHHQVPIHGSQPLPMPVANAQDIPGGNQIDAAPSTDNMQSQQQDFRPPIHVLDPQLAFSQGLIDADIISTTALQGAANHPGITENALAPGDIGFTFTLTPLPTLSQQPDDVPVSTSDAASYFFVYFEIIHSRYPFLRIQDCCSAYLNWKEHMQVPGSVESTWQHFLVTMVRTH